MADAAQPAPAITSEDASLDTFIQDLFDGLVLTFRPTAQTSSAGSASVHSPQTEIAVGREARIAQLLQESLQIGLQGQRAFRELLLLRQNAKCPVTDTIDHSRASPLSQEEEDLKTALLLQGFKLHATNEAAHIAPLRWVTSADAPNQEQRSRLWAGISRYFGLNVANRMSDLNAPGNGLLLNPLSHADFNRLELGFEAIEGKPAYYTVIHFDKKPAAEIRTKVAHLPQANGIAGPDPRLLAMRLAMCRILGACEAAKAIDAFYEELETTSTLSNDKAGLLITALSMVQVRHVPDTATVPAQG